MIKHVIFWKLKEACDKASASEEIRAGLEGLVGKVPGLIDAKVRRTYQGDWDLVLDSTFENAEAELHYQTNPLHVACKAIVHTYAIERACADYEIEIQSVIE